MPRGRRTFFSLISFLICEPLSLILKSFLHRIYYDLRNLGQLDRDRALNFAATNAFQAASTFAEAIDSGMELDSIEVEKSPFCRLNSNCWDVKLKFFDSEDGKRSKRLYRFTIDVANIMPVTLLYSTLLVCPTLIELNYVIKPPFS